MLKKWLHLIVGKQPPLTAASSEEPELIDLAHRVLSKNLKQKVRKEVERSLKSKIVDEDILEEVTEKITEAAAADPYYNRLFEERGKKR